MSFNLDAAFPDALTDYLLSNGLIEHGDTVVDLDKAGPGNMNLTLRATLSSGGSLVVKQAREWVERYPRIPAPQQRALVEAAFYRAVSGVPAVTDRMPALLHADDDAFLLVLEDLGLQGDYAHLYAKGQLTDGDLDQLLAWLDAVHAVRPPADPLFLNRKMRELNHEHVFVVPFHPDKGQRLDPICRGLDALAAEVRKMPDVLDAVDRAGGLYLADGRCLLHGDFYPGSWLHTDEGPMILDPEFAYLGDPAWDHGVLAAHLVLAQQSDHLVDRVLADSPDHTCLFAAVEVLRRLFGVAQLPLQADLEIRRGMADKAVDMLRTYA